MSAASFSRSACARSYRTERIFEALASILVPSIDTVPSFNNPTPRASSSTSTKAASNACLLLRRNAAIVSWSGCVLAAMKRAPMSR
jgi:hypothetical protein